MIAFITFDELREISKKADIQILLKEASKIENKTVFLSHSSDDHDLIPGVIKILKSHGGRVYVNEGDPKLPKSDFIKVANRLRSVVRDCMKFVLFVTPNTKDSKWIPWELGLGDGINLEKNVALFPSTEKWTEQEWAEQEYLGLYRRIIWGNYEVKSPEWLVFNHHNNSAQGLRSWLTA